VKTKRANENEAPIQSASRTKVYSVSFPVWRALSHVSKESTIGQMKHVNRMSAAVTRDARDFTSKVYRIKDNAKTIL